MMKGTRTLFKSPLHHRSHLSDASSSFSSSGAAVAGHRLYQVWRGRNVRTLISVQ
jgi:palmitoyltransferase ZDHHC9/14/18